MRGGGDGSCHGFALSPEKNPSEGMHAHRFYDHGSATVLNETRETSDTLPVVTEMLGSRSVILIELYVATVLTILSCHHIPAYTSKYSVDSKNTVALRF